MDTKTVLEGIRDLIFSDRYALKDPNRKFKVGDKVVVLISNEGWGQRGVGIIKSINSETKTAIISISGEENEIERPFSALDRVLESSPSDMWKRMSKWLPIKTENNEDEIVKHWQEEFFWALDGFKFSPGGRINAYLGSEELRNLVEMPRDFDNLGLTAFNCYVLAIQPNLDSDKSTYGVDSRKAIMDTAENMVETMARGGGCGLNLSPLRPSRAHVGGVNGHSSGSVSWGAMYSFLTGLVEQGGSRRGALMLMLDASHPDIVEFIFSKVRAEEVGLIKEKWRDKFPHANFKAHGIENANISVAISDNFMEAVKNDLDWDLIFPDYEAVGREVYNREWDGIIQNWIKKGLPVKIYTTIKARDLWNCLMEAAWRSAEPGIVFLERYNKESNSWYFNDIIATNPCGRLGLLFAQ